MNCGVILLADHIMRFWAFSKRNVTPKILSMYYEAIGKFKELQKDEGAMEMTTKSIVNGTMNLYVLAKRVKCANVCGESMNADVEVCESSKSDAHVDDIERVFDFDFDVDVRCENVNGDVYDGEMVEAVDHFTEDIFFYLESRIENLGMVVCYLKGKKWQKR